MTSSSLFAYLRLLAALIILLLASSIAPQIFALFGQASEPELVMVFFSVATIFSLSFLIFYLSWGTSLPNFVIAIFFGMAASPLLEPITHNHAALGSLVGFGATLILFGGGLETPFENFKKLIWKIFALSFPGLFITATLFSLVIAGITSFVPAGVSTVAAILLGAILASTDPAAIIPVLKRLRFKNQEIKDLVISESAVTDVTGTLLTVAFLTLLGAGVMFENGIFSGYGGIFTAQTGNFLLQQLGFGVIFGVLGYSLLAVLTHFKTTHSKEYEVDSAFFLFIPVIIFTLAIAFGGSGYLAAFIAGLLFKVNDNLHETERFFNHIIDGFFKPTIFLLLGALVNIPELIRFAPIGILAAIVFMTIIRPMSVFISMSPFLIMKKDRVTYKDLLFISFVRETGAIPAVLLVTVSSLAIPGLDGLLPVGMWVILLTLIIEPPLTPYVATKLGIAELIPEDQPHLNGTPDSYVILATRGTSYEHRLPIVAAWASRHSIPKIAVMLCLEYKYKPEIEQTIEEKAQKQMATINAQLVAEGKKPLEFKFFSSAGLLQENIDYLSQNDDKVVAIFVGRMMLDYRLNEIKKLGAPLYFME